MKKKDDVRNKLVVVRMNDKEFEQLKKFCNQTTERSLSGYLREVALKHPVIVKYRNQSADDFLKGMLELKKN